MPRLDPPFYRSHHAGVPGRKRSQSSGCHHRKLMRSLQAGDPKRLLDASAQMMSYTAQLGMEMDEGEVDLIQFIITL